ncbi:PhzF family phenazine biosynthesis protein, partial [Massilia sp. CT11-108]|uniref:PhzF family phenazine biosynthesis protein n=1 Tax=Massilia sp. CT11-108 TaxID=3393900 RepID=UPI0039A5D461
MTITTSHILRIAAFSDGDAGGNPAGVWIGESLPPADEMQRLAHAVGYSETAFAEPQGKGWRVRYFSPASEVPFCGHATAFASPFDRNVAIVQRQRIHAVAVAPGQRGAERDRR